MKRYILFVVVLSGILAGIWYYQRHRLAAIIVDIPQAQDFENFIENKSATDTPEQLANKIPSVSKEPVVSSTPKIADKINLNIPFTSQAPTANWDQPFQDACEEASILMVDYYYQDKKFPAKTEVEKILLDMVGWQIEHWGGHLNLTVAQLADYVQTKHAYRVEIVDNINAELIKKYLNQGVPVIVPANGKKLANPNFKNGGPVYHMLVIKGYVGDKFITNDPGTRLGADFIYTEENLINSIADWDGNEKGASGSKRALILYKE